MACVLAPLWQEHAAASAVLTQDLHSTHGVIQRSTLSARFSDWVGLIISPCPQRLQPGPGNTGLLNSHCDY